MSDRIDEQPQSRRAPAKKPTLPWLYAIPEGRLPDSIDVAGRNWALEQTFKHDFFAATGCYVCNGERAVLKVGRVGSMFGIPLRWIGRRLRDHESRLYRRLEDLPGVPAYLGDVGPTGFAHAFVPGRPLGRRDEVGDQFFADLEALLGAIHAREIAYVDLNKRQNVLLGEDGRPYLIDFQISYELRPRGWRRNPLSRWLLRRFQNADRYHFCKHKRRLRPDQLTSAEQAIAERVGFWIRLHRAIARPIIQARRVLLRSLRKREEMDVAGSSAK